MPAEIRRISTDSFCTIVRTIPSAECKSHIIKIIFIAQKGETSLHDIKCIISNLSEEALLHKETLKSASQSLVSLVNVYTPFESKVNDCSGAPRDTNGVERVNQASKDSITPCFLKAREKLV